ncbi:MAG: hypothetical protein AAB680_01365, partial [Pseudomonadota bacterium]
SADNKIASPNSLGFGLGEIIVSLTSGFATSWAFAQGAAHAANPKLAAAQKCFGENLTTIDLT